MEEEGFEVINATSMQENAPASQAVNDQQQPTQQKEMEEPDNEAYYTWKKNAPVLYDLLMTADLGWPSLTVEWFPDKLMPPQRSCGHRLLLGTATSGEEQEYVKVMNLMTPSKSQESELQAREASSNGPGDIDGEIGGFSKSNSAWKMSTQMRMNHCGEVNRARYMPQNPFVVASKTGGNNVHVFHLTRHPSEPTNTEVNPQLTLAGHDKDGFGLSWNVFSEGLLLSGANDGKICLWDVQSLPKDHKKDDLVLPRETFTGGHKGSVEGVQWSVTNEHLFASVGDDGMVLLWDSREGKHVMKMAAHQGEGRTVAFNHYNQHLLASGGDDKVVALWDLRKTEDGKAPVGRLEGHTEEVTCVEWSPFHEDVLASGSADSRANVWDLSQAEPLVFSHAGHRGGVSDISWNQHDPYTIASVAEDASMHVWRPRDHLLQAS